MSATRHAACENSPSAAYVQHLTASNRLAFVLPHESTKKDIDHHKHDGRYAQNPPNYIFSHDNSPVNVESSHGDSVGRSRWQVLALKRCRTSTQSTPPKSLHCRADPVSSLLSKTVCTACRCLCLQCGGRPFHITIVCFRSSSPRWWELRRLKAVGSAKSTFGMLRPG